MRDNRGDPQPGVVLVHGLWHDPRHFHAVADELRRTGIEVVVPRLHRGSLEADTAVVQAAVDTLGLPPLVLGHSYGGSVITGLTGARHLVYLAAFVPAEDESAANLRGSTPELNAAALRDPDGTTHLDPQAAVEVLYGDCSPECATAAVRWLQPQDTACVRGVPSRFAWRETGTTYVICTRDRAVHPAVQERMATRCGSTLRWSTGHSPFLSHPHLVVQLITKLLTGPGLGGS